jgi:hypothetical protein
VFKVGRFGENQYFWIPVPFIGATEKKGATEKRGKDKRMFHAVGLSVIFRLETGLKISIVPVNIQKKCRMYTFSNANVIKNEQDYRIVF